MSEAIPAVELRIADNAHEASAGLLLLTTVLERLRTVVSNGLGLENVATGLGRLNESLTNAVPEDSINRLERIAAAMERLNNAGGININVGNVDVGGIEAIENAANTQTAEAVHEVAEAMQTVVTVGHEEAEAVAEVNAALNGTEMTHQQVEEAVDNVADAFRTAANAARNYAAEQYAAGNGVEHMGRECRIAVRHTNGLLRSFARIAQYRAMRWVLKQITEGFKTGVTNVREYSKAIDGHFAAAMNTADSVLLKFKNTIGAAVAPVLEMLIPVMQRVVSWIINIVNAINQFFALLNGQATWTKAIDVSADSLDNVKKNATGAGKAVKNLLADFDELNIIQSQSGGGGGGSGSNNGIDYKKMFTDIDAFDGRIKAIIGWMQENMDVILSAAKLIGAALLGWRLSTMLTSPIGTMFRQMIGIYIAIQGAKKMWKAFSDQLQNGVDLKNFTELVEGAAIAVFGLGLAFGWRGVGFGLLTAGILGVVGALKDIVTNGEASKEALDQLKLSMFIGGIGASLMTGNWVFALAGAIGAAAIEIYQHKEEIVGYIKDNIDQITAIMKDAGYAGIAVGAMLAFSGMVGPGIGMIAAGLGLTMIGNGLSSTIADDVDTTLKNIADLVGQSLLAVGAIMAVSGVATIPGIVLMVMGMGLSIYGKGSGNNLLEYIKNAWKDIRKWAMPISLGFMAFGAVMALTGVAIIPGLKMMAIGAAGLAADATLGDLLSDMKKVWDDIKAWADPLAVGSFVIGTILALTGVAIGPGLAMMAAGIAVEVAANGESMLGQLTAIWTEIEKWATPLSAGSFVLGAILALTGVGIVPGVAMMLAGVTGFALANGESLLTTITGAWNDIKSFWDTTISPALTAAATFIYDNFIAPVIRFFDRLQEAIKRVTDFFAGETRDEFLDADYTDWARVEAYKDIAKNYDDNSTHAGKIRKALAYEIDMNNGNPIDVASETAKDMINSMIQAFVNEDIGEEAYYIINTLFNEMKDYGWTLEDIIGNIDLSSLDVDQLESLKDAIEWINDEYGTNIELPAIDGKGLEDGLAGTEKSVRDYINAIKADVASLDGLQIGFVGSGFGGRFRTFGSTDMMFAGGGFPSEGQMFVARERGPEMVGSINGKTAVANNDQIVAGVANGVAAGQAEQNGLLRQQNEYLRALLNKESTVKIEPSSALGKVVRRSEAMYARNAGY